MPRPVLFMQLAGLALLLSLGPQPVETYKFPDALGPALGGVPVINILMGNLGIYFESVVSYKSGAADN
jgi:hypothetical protein